MEMSSQSLSGHSSADDMALEHTDRKLNGSHPKAGIAVVAKRKIPLTAGNLTLVQPSASTYSLPSQKQIHYHIQSKISCTFL